MVRLNSLCRDIRWSPYKEYNNLKLNHNIVCEFRPILWVPSSEQQTGKEDYGGLDSWKSRTAAIEENTSSFLPFLSFFLLPPLDIILLLILVFLLSFHSRSLLSLRFLSRIVSLLTLLISLTSRSFIFLFSFPFLNTTRRDPFPRLVSFRFLSFSRCYSLSRFGHFFVYLSSLAIKLLHFYPFSLLSSVDLVFLSIFFFFCTYIMSTNVFDSCNLSIFIT